MVLCPPRKFKVFHTHRGTPLEIVGANVEMGYVWVVAHPDDCSKTFVTHIDMAYLAEPKEEIAAFIKKFEVSA